MTGNMYKSRIRTASVKLKLTEILYMPLAESSQTNDLTFLTCVLSGISSDLKELVNFAVCLSYSQGVLDIYKALTSYTIAEMSRSFAQGNGPKFLHEPYLKTQRIKGERKKKRKAN